MHIHRGGGQQPYIPDREPDFGPNNDVYTPFSSSGREWLSNNHILIKLLLPSLCHTGLLLPAGWAEVWWSCWWELHTGWSTAGWGYLHASLGGLQCVYNIMAWGCHTTDASSLSDVCCLPIPANTSCQSWVASTITSSCSCTRWFGWDLLGPNAGVFTSDLVTHHYSWPGVLSWLCDVNIFTI